MSKEKNWFDGVDAEKVQNAAEIPEKVRIPEPGKGDVTVQIKGSPREISTEKGPATIADVIRTDPQPEAEQTLFMGASLKFNMAKGISRAGEDFSKFDLVGSTWRIWAVSQDGNTYHHCELVASGK